MSGEMNGKVSAKQNMRAYRRVNRLVSVSRRGVGMRGRLWLACVVSLLAGLGLAWLVYPEPLSIFNGSARGSIFRSPGFQVDSFSTPTVFSQADNARCVKSSGVTCDAYQVTVTNAGSEASNGSIPITIADVLPAGLTVEKISLIWSEQPTVDFGEFGFCNTTEVKCMFPAPLKPDDRLEMIVNVTVDNGVSGVLAANKVMVSGGGAASVQTESGNSVGSTPAGFGLSEFGFFIGGLNGRVDSQAGDHPYEVTTTIGLNNMFREPPDISNGLGKTSVNDIKTVVVNLPLGFTGSILAAPQCTLATLSAEGGCPKDTVVGHLFSEPVSGTSVDSPIWNLVPEHGVPAEFGYRDALRSSHVFYSRVAPTPAGYVLQVTNPDIPQVSLAHIIATFYGEPAAKQEEIARSEGKEVSAKAQIPFFTNPTICDQAALTASIHIDSWKHPGRYNPDGTPDFSDPNWAGATSVSPPPSGCNLLQFPPELKAQPTTNQADSPSGLDFELKLPQTENPGTFATPPLKRSVVTLPAGMSVDPSAGDGLAACSEEQIGWTGPAAMNFNAAPPACPEASKIGTLELTTPLIAGVLTGQIYIATQNTNPFGSVLAAYVVVNDPDTGVVIKLAGQFIPDPNTGQITAVFDENPQLPFSDLKLHFFGGPRAELATPENCGLYTITSTISPWSTPDSGPDATPFDSFPINTGCVNGFNPSFTGGSTNLQAGAYSPFVASFSRSDTDQPLAGLSVTLPPGMLAKITGVPLCPDSNATAGTCPENTKVGTVTAGAGPGPNPLFVDGNAYLTGPYHGAPYGLSVVVPAIAGPFNFGNVVVRQALHINRTTTRVTDTSDPFPTILQPTGTNHQTIGIPIRLRRIDVNINRPTFTFNPTSCNHLPLNATLNSPNTTSTQTTPYQVTNCQTLKFDPKFTVTTNGKTSKQNGASLTATLTYPTTPQGTETNIQTVKVSLPKQLPSRLTTLQKACLAQTYETNPANCPPASIIGHATVTTPLLPQPLTGPAYFISHGSAKFPDLVILLQGNNITIELTGNTFIKQGITTTTFKTTPDTPFTTFTLTLPQGPHSALAANGNLCNTKLTMPTQLTAQNNTQKTQNTPIKTTNCTKHHNKHKPQHHHKTKA